MANPFDIAESELSGPAAENPFDVAEREATGKGTVGTVAGQFGAAKRGVITALGIPDVLQAVGTAGISKPSIGQERKAFVRSMTDPQYQEQLIQAGDDRGKLLRVESMRGPAAKLAEQMLPAQTLEQANVEEVAQRQARVQAIPMSEAQQRLAQSQTSGEKWKAWLRDPVELTSTIVLESLPPSIAGALVGAPLGPGGVAAGVGASSAAQTFAGEFLGAASQTGVDITNPDDLQAFLDDEARFRPAFSTALIKAGIVGGVDALTAGNAGRFIEPALKQALKQRVIATGKEVGLQMAGGAGGEFAAQVASGQQLDPFDIAMEALAEVATTPGEVYSNIRGQKKPAASTGKTPVQAVAPAAAGGNPFDQAEAEVRAALKASPGGELGQAPTTAVKPQLPQPADSGSVDTGTKQPNPNFAPNGQPQSAQVQRELQALPGAAEDLGGGAAAAATGEIAGPPAAPQTKPPAVEQQLTDLKTMVANLEATIKGNQLANPPAQPPPAQLQSPESGSAAASNTGLDPNAGAASLKTNPAGVPTPAAGSPVAPGGAANPPAATTEAEAIEQFLAANPDQSGSVPAQQPYLPTRDEAFAAQFNAATTPEAMAKLGYRPSTIQPKMEDARDAIAVGRKLGYRDADIAAYLRKNYPSQTNKFNPQKKRRSPFVVRPRPDGIPDILDAIQELGGVSPPDAAVYGNWKDAFTGPARMLLRKGGRSIDKLVDDLSGKHARAGEQAQQAQTFRVQSPDDIIEAVREAVAQREKLRTSGGGADMQADRFWTAISREPAQKHGLVKINADQLQPGDKFRLRGPGYSHEELEVRSVQDGMVTLKDGAAFGWQEVPEGTEFWVSKKGLEVAAKQEEGSATDANANASPANAPGNQQPGGTQPDRGAVYDPASDPGAVRARERMERKFRTEFGNPGATIAFAAGPGGIPGGNGGRRSAAATLQSLAELFGKRVVWFTAQGVEQKRTLHGWANPEGNHLFVNADFPSTTLGTLAHELFHSLQRSNPQLYADFKAALLQLAKLPGSRYEALKLDAGYKAAAIPDELVSDFAAHAFSDPQFLKDLAKHNPGVFRRIVTRLVKFIDRVLAKITRTRQAAADVFTDLQAARKLLIGALNDFAEYEGNVRQVEQEIKQANDVLRAGNATITKPGLVDIGGEASPFSVTAHHGTPHKVDRFSTAKIGTGEGAQVYGWGLYFAENEKVAEEYRKNLAGQGTVDGQPYNINQLEHFAAASVFMSGTREAAVKELRNRATATRSWNPTNAAHLENVADWIENAKRIPNYAEPQGGNKYTVTLNAVDEDLLDWDKPLSEQSEKVKKALRDFAEDNQGRVDAEESSEWGGLSAAEYARRINPEGAMIYNLITQHQFASGTSSERSPAAASEYLASLGIKGIRYADEGSRSQPDVRLIELHIKKIKEDREFWQAAGGHTPDTRRNMLASYESQLRDLELELRRAREFKPTYNYVIFDENDITITHENGQPVTMEQAFSVESNDDLFGAPESVAEQRARVQREAKAKAEADKLAEKKAFVARGGERLTGKDLDTTQEMFGAEVRQDKAGQGSLFSIETEFPEDFPDAIVMTSGAAMKANPNYQPAKAGDNFAAARLAEALMPPGVIARIKARANNPIIVAVHAEEASGRNKIPQGMAEVIADRGGWQADTEIIQANRAGHTGATAMKRLMVEAAFSGPVEAGRDYVLVDDMLTSGATVNALRNYIQQQGGRPVMVLAMAASASPQTGHGAVMRVRPTTHALLAKKFDIPTLNNLLSQHGIAANVNALTNSQARYLANFKDVDRLRAAIIEAGQAAGIHPDQGLPGRTTVRPKDVQAVAVQYEIPPQQLNLLLEKGRQPYQGELSFVAPGQGAAGAGIDGGKLNATGPGSGKSDGGSVEVFGTSLATHKAADFQQDFARNSLVSSIDPSQVADAAVPTYNVNGQKIESPADFARTMLAIRSPYNESLKLVILDNNNVVQHSEVLYAGALDGLYADTRDFLRLFEKHASKGRRMMFAHNHPSGVVSPSDADRLVTTKAERAAKAAGFEIIDHVITNGDEFFSFKAQQVMPLNNSPLAPWEVLPRKMLQHTTVADNIGLEKLVKELRQGNQDFIHIIYLNTRHHVTAIERTDAKSGDFSRRVIRGIGREGAMRVLIDFGPRTNPATAADMVRTINMNSGSQTQVIDFAANTVMSGRLAGYISDAPASQFSVENDTMDLFSWTPAKSEAKAASEPKATDQPDNHIGDFGEKIAGARKDVWNKYADTMAQDLPAEYADISLAKHFPEPDYEAVIERGADVDNLALMKALRDMIPAKPRQPWKLKRWGELVTGLHKIVQKMVNEGFKVPPARLDEIIAKTGGEVAEKITLYRRLGYPLFRHADGWKIRNATFSVFNSVKYEPQKSITYAEKEYRVHQDLASADPDRAAAYDEVLEKLKVKLTEEAAEDTGARETKFSLYQDRYTKELFLGKKGLRGVIRLKAGFKTVKEAREFLENQRPELEKIWEGMKQGPQLRKAANEERVGPARRDGNITPEAFTEAFGFRGVQFGNYVEGPRRQADLNEAYDALIDLSQALDVPPKALSLDGSLGLAFGARGIGGYKAHYEPGQVVINITKTNGPGSLAHEWFHALDNYFARLDESGTTTGRSGKFSTSNLTPAKNIRPEVWQSFKQIRDVLDRGSFSKRSDHLDATRSKPYYGTTIEKAARAFEIYVSDRLEKTNIVNDYLANIYKAAESSAEWDDSAYPYQKEMDQDGIRAAYDALFNTLDTKPTERGEMLFSVEAEEARAGELEAYHGSPAGTFQTFNESDRGIFFTNKADLAEGYTFKRGLWRSAGQSPKVYHARLTMRNPLVIDAGGARNNNIPFPGQEYKRTVFGNLPANAVSVAQAATKAFALGHDGVIIRDVMDANDVTDKTRSNVYAVKSPSQIQPAAGDRFSVESDIAEAEAELMTAIRQHMNPPEGMAKAQALQIKNDAATKLRGLLAEQLKQMTTANVASTTPEQTAEMISQTVDLLNAVMDDIQTRKAKGQAVPSDLPKLRNDLQTRLTILKGWSDDQTELAAAGVRGEPAPKATTDPDARQRFMELEAATDPTQRTFGDWWATVKQALRYLTSPIPELPLTGERAEKSSLFRRGYRLFAVENNAVRKAAAEKVNQVVEPLVKLGRKPADNARLAEYYRLGTMLNRARQAMDDARASKIAVRMATLEADLNKDPFNLFRRLVLYRDLWWRGTYLKNEQGKPITLPNGLTVDDVAGELRKLTAAIADHPNGLAITEALRRHYALTEELQQSILAHGEIIPESLRNPLYFPHHIIDGWTGRVDRVRPTTEEDFRRYLIAPMGSGKLIQTDYLKAMYLHTADVLAHNARVDLVDKYWKPYDISEELKAAHGEAWNKPWNIPPGYKLFTPFKKLPLRMDYILSREVLADKLGVLFNDGDLAARAGEMGKVLKVKPEDLHAALVAGEKIQWALPVEIADALNGIARRELAASNPGLGHSIGMPFRVLNNFWKKTKLFAPWNWVRYEYGNLSTDAIDKVLAADPGAAKHLARAARELWQADQGEQSPEFKAAAREGVFDTICLLYTSPSPRDRTRSRMPSSA